MTPLFFGLGNRRLFGLYTPARPAANGAARAALLCAPLGQEYLCAHRSMRQLGLQLSSCGYDVLRFDYFGTGDSSGDFLQADLSGWEEDIATAIDELKDTSGARRVVLVGMRLGAALAARVAVKRPRDLQALVLWDPVVAGTEYLHELLSFGSGETPSAAPTRQRAAGIGGGHEVLGFPLNARMEDSLAELDLVALVPSLPERSLIAVTQPTPSYPAVVEAVAKRPESAIVCERLGGLPAWLNDEDTGAGAVPINVLQRITQWLTP